MGVIDQTYTAKNIIERFTGRAYFDGHVIASECDYLYKPDIATIDRQHKLNEYEIKVSRSDLRKELTYIEMATEDHEQQRPLDFFGITPQDSLKLREELLKLNQDRKYSTHDNKYVKHRYYLFDEVSKYGRGQKPNRFYFLIPRELYEVEKERLDRIPKYGVIDAKTFFSLKRCQPLHNDPVEPHAIWQVALNLTGRLKKEAT